MNQAAKHKHFSILLHARYQRSAAIALELPQRGAG
jgi:hypothetical protein